MIKKYKPLVDKMYWIIFVPTVLLMIALTVLAAIAPLALIITLITDIFVVYFLVSPLFGYVELRETSLYVKFGFFMSKEIPYNRIREVVKERKIYSDSMISLKNALDHVNVKYNKFDVVSVSVVDNDCFIAEMRSRLF